MKLTSEQRDNVARSIGELHILIDQLNAFSFEAQNIAAEYARVVDLPAEEAFAKVDPLIDRVAALFNGLREVTR